MSKIRISFAILVSVSLTTIANAAIPLVINHQGYVRVNDAPFNGTGQFKFGLYDFSEDIWLWTNDGSQNGNAVSGANVPTNPVSVTVTNGLYSIGLGDASLSNMTAIPSSVFDDDDVYLRIYFSDGVNGEQSLGDQPMTSVPYAYHAVHSDTADQASYTPGSLYGGVISNNATDTKLDISEIWCANDANDQKVHGAALTKRMLVWAAGNDQGGYVYQGGESATPTTQTMIYIFAIADSSGANAGDFMFTNDDTPNTLPSGYDTKRLIGARVWLGSAWCEFLTTGVGNEKWVHYYEPFYVYDQNIVAAPAWDTVEVKDSSNDWVLPPATSRLGEFVVWGGRTGGAGGGVVQMYLRIKGATIGAGTSKLAIQVNSGTDVTAAGARMMMPIDDLGRFEIQGDGSGATIETKVAVVSYMESL